MSFVAIQLLNGLSHATTLFLMAAGLTLIFGVTRIVNFAHGSFYMLGALLGAHGLVVWFPGWGESAWLYAFAIVLGAACAALVGAAAEFILLRRLYGAPELYQLVATFGLSLALHDGLRAVLGPDEVFAPRFPGLHGALTLGDDFYFPTYQAVMIAVGPLVWLALHGLLTRTRYGAQVRAATQDRTMLAALGVNPAPLMLATVALGCGLAGLGGALQLPREPAHLQMDVNMVVETFVVVVTGGLGSLGGAFAAALLIGVVHALGVSLFPQATLVLVFLTMAVVLAVRPQGLAGRVLDGGPQPMAQRFVAWPAMGWRTWSAAGGLAALAVGAGPYWQTLASDMLILVMLGVSLQAMMALGGLVSFGHAAYFGLGAYAAALVHAYWGWALPAALLAACVAGGIVAAALGPLLVRRSGVYLAMLSLALAQVVWALASQWVTLTGGDNGLIGLRLVAPDWQLVFYAGLWLCALGSVLALGRLSRSTLGAALQAVRDAPLRASASGLDGPRIQCRVYVVSAVLAAAAGALFAAHQGAVFPSVAGISTSVDALLVVLLGGMHQLWGSVVGAAVLGGAASQLGRNFEYWRGALGVLVMAMMVLAPSGALGWWSRRNALATSQRGTP